MDYEDLQKAFKDGIIVAPKMSAMDCIYLMSLHIQELQKRVGQLEAKQKEDK